MKELTIIFSIVLLLGSCTIEKRLHNPGYNVQWNKIMPKAVERSTETRIIRSSEIERDHNLDSDKEINEIGVNDSIISQQRNVAVHSEKSLTIKIPQKIDHSFSVKSIKVYNLSKSNDNQGQLKKFANVKRNVDWELLGNIGAGILILLILGFALFGSGTLASIAAILIAIGYFVLTIAAIVCICWFLWFIFFGWWLR